MRWGALVVLAGCNRIFGLTGNVNERVFDAPADAAPRCPGPNEPAPVYSTQLHDVIPQYCSDYTQSPLADRAFARCMVLGLSEGVVDGELKATAIAPTLPGSVLIEPRLAPEGDELFVEQSTAVEFRYSRYVPVTGGWTWAADLSSAMTKGLALSAPSLRSGGRRMLTFSTTTLDEWGDEGNDTWTLRDSYQPSDFALTYISNAGLTQDGLAAVFYGADANNDYAMYYVSRTSIDARFENARLIAIPPFDKPVYIAPDCARIYFDGISHVFFAQQL